jgi:hypothetical protein
MTQIILFKKQNVWGNELLYPANKQGELLLSLSGRKTFNKSDFEIYKQLGYIVKEYGSRPELTH